MGYICSLLAMLAQYGWKVHQIDVKATFMNGDLKENVYMTLPKRIYCEGSRT